MILKISAYVSLTVSGFSNETNYIKCCTIGKKKYFKEKQDLFDRRENVIKECYPFLLTGTFVRSIKASNMAIKNRQINISFLSLFILKLYDPSSVSLQTHDTA